MRGAGPGGTGCGAEGTDVRRAGGGGSKDTVLLAVGRGRCATRVVDDGPETGERCGISKKDSVELRARGEDLGKDKIRAVII